MYRGTPFSGKRRFPEPFRQKLSSSLRERMGLRVPLLPPLPLGEGRGEGHILLPQGEGGRRPGEGFKGGKTDQDKNNTTCFRPSSLSPNVLSK